MAWLCFRGSARRHHGFLSLASQWPPGSRPPGRVGARDQTRRLPPRRAPGRPQGAPVLPPRHEWSDRFHRISEALASLRTRSVRIDGEAVVLCPKPGLWLFDQLHSCRRDRDVNLYVFDLLEFNGRVSDRFRLRSARRGSRGMINAAHNAAVLTIARSPLGRASCMVERVPATASALSAAVPGSPSIGIHGAGRLCRERHFLCPSKAAAASQAEGPMREIVLSVGKQSPVPNSRPELRWLLRQVVEIVEDLCTAISDPYRPERHYMRGPGPRWRAKHGTVAAPAC